MNEILGYSLNNASKSRWSSFQFTWRFFIARFTWISVCLWSEGLVWDKISFRHDCWRGKKNVNTKSQDWSENPRIGPKIQLTCDSPRKPVSYLLQSYKKSLFYLEKPKQNYCTCLAPVTKGDLPKKINDFSGSQKVTFSWWLSRPWKFSPFSP